MQSARPALRRSLQQFGVSVFGEMTRLAQLHGAVNLSQGFPDFDGPERIKAAACEAIRQGKNQYARSMGQLSLTHAIAHKVRRHYGLEVDPLTQVAVFAGCSEALFCALMGLLEPGDEAILFEPFFDCYPADVVMAGATPVYCRLSFPELSLDLAALEALITPRTRLILLNSPHNPTGKVFTRAELEGIAALCIRYKLLAVTDEVYEHLTYDGAEHIPLATLPGMFERTLTLSSTAKTFSLTGWKVGYAVGPAELVAAAQTPHQFTTFSGATPLQEAMSEGLASPPEFYETLRQAYTARRDFLAGVLDELGFEVIAPQGTYFIMAGFSRFSDAHDEAFSRWLIEEVGVACIPPSSFFASRPSPGEQLVRFAFCKRDETLREAAARLAVLKHKRMS